MRHNMGISGYRPSDYWSVTKTIFVCIGIFLLASLGDVIITMW